VHGRFFVVVETGLEAVTSLGAAFRAAKLGFSIGICYFCPQIIYKAIFWPKPAVVWLNAEDSGFNQTILNIGL